MDIGKIPKQELSHYFVQATKLNYELRPRLKLRGGEIIRIMQMREKDNPACPWFAGVKSASPQNAFGIAG